MFSRSPGALSCLAACRNCNRDHNMRSWHPREELFLLMDVDYDCVWCFLLFCLSILFILLPHYPHVPLTRRFGLPPLALYDPCRRSGVWNLCSGEGGPCLIHWTVGRASSVIFSDQFFQHEFQHHSNTNFWLSSGLLAEGLPGSSVKQQPAPASQETVLIVREQTQDQAGMTDVVPWTL